MNTNPSDWERSYTDGALASWESEDGDNLDPDCLGQIYHCPMISIMCPWNERCQRLALAEMGLSEEGEAND